MTDSTIVTVSTVVQVDPVTDVVITLAVPDEEIGDFVREIRVFGAPPGEGLPAPIVYTLRLRSPVRANINVSAPSSDF